MTNLKITFIVLLVTTLMSYDLSAQQSISNQKIKNAKLLQTEFKEAFENNINVSSGVIVGLIIGQSLGIQSIDQVVMDKSGWPLATRFCLRASSNDGLFWSENSYQIDETPYWKIAPISKRFKKQLKKYGHKKIIAKVELSEITTANQHACELSSVIYAPIISTHNTTNQTVNIYINSSNRPMLAELWKKDYKESDTALVELKCEDAKVEGASIYDKICRFNLSQIEYSGLAELRMHFDTEFFGSEQWFETIALPKH